ncbi:MAG: ribosome assembly cofactor RimP [Bacteroidia bacterium]|nr:ribosome assembly cofactor RimP [Bacteroidia bacterium]
MSPFLFDKIKTMLVTETMIRDIVGEKLEGTDCFVVEVKVHPGRISVLLDKPSGIKIEECAEVNRHLNHELEESRALEHYNIEVSSPGMEEPLKVLQQYRRRIGKTVGVVTKDGMRREGILKNADENLIELEEIILKKSNGKKISHSELRTIPMNEIKETRVVFKF